MGAFVSSPVNPSSMSSQPGWQASQATFGSRLRPSPLLKARLGFLAAWAAFFLVLFVLPQPAGLSPAGRATLAVVAWAGLIWMTEAVPVGVSGILIPALLVLAHAVTEGWPGFANM